MIEILAAEIGALSLWLLYAWLGSAAAAGYLSHRKGYGERPGLASGLLLSLVGVVVWLVLPARDDSLWKKVGAFGRPKASDAPPRDAAEPVSGDTAPPKPETSERP